MTKSIWIDLLLALIPALSFAQSEEGGRVQVYSVTGVGRASGDNAQLQIGGGVDAQIYKGIGVGGGFNYWLTNKVGVRFEFRDHVFSAGNTTSNIYGLRGGVAFAF